MHFGESNSFTRQVSFKRTKIGENAKIEKYATFWVIFKQCVSGSFQLWIFAQKLGMYCYCMVIYFWQDFISCHVKKSIFLADCICLFLQANQIVECQSIKSVGVAEFSIFLSISSRREDLVSLFDHGLLEHLLVVCCFRWNTAVKDKSIVLEKDTFWHSSF